MDQAILMLSPQESAKPTPALSKAHPFFERTAFAAMYFYAVDHRCSSFVQAEREERPGKPPAELVIKSKQYFLTIKTIILWQT